MAEYNKNLLQNQDKQSKKNKKEELLDSTINAGIANAAGEVVQRYGSANKEHLVAFSGKDNEAGKTLSRSLKSISESKVNPDYKEANIKQQAGFSAEVKTTARDNAEKIISGDKNTKTTRTDDMVKQSDGNGGTVGGTNDQLYDIAEVDKNGIYVEGTARQLKFVGGTPEQCADKLLDKGYDKYRDADVAIEVPSDYYDGVKKKLAEKAESLKKQIEDAEKKGNSELAARHKAQLEKVEKTSQNLKKGSVSNKEAVFARKHPKLSTALDIGKISHRAGMEAAKSGAAIGGGISFIRNSVAVIKGDKEVDEAILDVGKDTGKAALVSYGTGFAGSALKGAMQNAPSKFVQTLSKTNLPAVAVTTALETGKTLTKFISGEINGTECLTELGEKGTGMISSAMFATAFQIMIPIPIVGALIGGMVGYAFSSAFYNRLTGGLQEAKMAHEERLHIEAECAEAIKMLREYRRELEQIINNYLSEHKAVFDSAFDDMKEAYALGDADGFVSGANKITRQLGGKPQFEMFDEFDALMESTEAFKL
jgi:hypothetical protein